MLRINTVRKHGKVPSCSFKVKIEGHGIGFEDKGETTLEILSLQLTEHSNIFLSILFSVSLVPL